MENVTITKEEYERLLVFEKSYKEIEEGIASFYESEDDDKDLCDIGEFTASYFGWL
jgi:hypothetical protein